MHPSPIFPYFSGFSSFFPAAGATLSGKFFDCFSGFFRMAVNFCDGLR